MKKADEQGIGKAEGVKIARESLNAAKDLIQGAYIMPPFGRYHLAIEVLDGLVISSQKDAKVHQISS